MANMKPGDEVSLKANKPLRQLSSDSEVLLRSRASSKDGSLSADALGAAEVDAEEDDQETGDEVTPSEPHMLERLITARGGLNANPFPNKKHEDEPNPEAWKPLHSACRWAKVHTETPFELLASINTERPPRTHATQHHTPPCTTRTTTRTTTTHERRPCRLRSPPPFTRAASDMHRRGSIQGKA